MFSWLTWLLIFVVGITSAYLMLSQTAGKALPMVFRPFSLMRKTVLTNGSSGEPTIQLTFALPPDEALDVDLARGERVKVMLPLTWQVPPDATKGRKPRSYSPTSEAGRKGSFELTVKVYEHGICSRYLDSLEIGESIRASAPFPPFKQMQRLPGGTHIGMVALGIGITEVVHVAQAELARDDVQQVRVLHINRTPSDAVLHETLDRLALQYPHKFDFHKSYSRTHVDGAHHGRASDALLSTVFGDWQQQRETIHARFLVVGTKPMMRDVNAMIERLGWKESETKLLSKNLLAGLSETVSNVFS